MVLFGTLVNCICILIGGILGLFFTDVHERYKETVMQGISLVVILIGLQMAITTEVIIIVLLSILIGALVGEFFRLEKSLNNLGDSLAARFTTPVNSNENMSQGFVTATLLFIMGAMSIIGALDSGLRGDHELLITKGIIDGFVALVLTTTLGFGVIFSIIPVIIYQGSITLLATQIDRHVSEYFLDGLIVELTAVGGILIVAIGLNLLKVTKIRIGNLLPSLLAVVFIYFIYYIFML